MRMKMRMADRKWGRTRATSGESIKDESQRLQGTGQEAATSDDDGRKMGHMESRPSVVQDTGVVMKGDITAIVERPGYQVSLTQAT